VSKRCSWVGILLAFVLCACTRLAASEAVHRVRVSIVRHEAAIHTSLGNQDIYLIYVTPKSGKAFAATMVDEYPSYADGLPFQSVSDGTTFSVALRRTTYCDNGPENGDPAASADLPVRCFAVIHDSWRIHTRRARDEWWK
jgi:hypothetical protein